MNNNCTKCGNPLQPGTTICPICGTNNINASVAPAAPAPAAAPVADPAAAPAVAPAPAPAAPAPAVAPAPAPVAPETPAAPAAPAAPATATETPAAPAAPATPAASAAPAAKEKKPVNKKLFIIVGIVAAVIIIGAVVAMIVINNSSSVEEPPAPNNQPTENKTAVSNKMSLNGFSFIIPTGWSIDTTGGITALVDRDTSAIVHLLHESGSFDSINQEDLKSYFTNQGFDNIEVSEKTISGKKAILVSGSKSSTTYQYDFYYLESTEAIVGSAVVYVDSEAKNKNSKIVENIMNSLSYSPADNMASELSMHNSIIADFSGALNGNSGTDYNNQGNQNNSGDQNNDNNQGNQNNNDNQNENGGGRF